MNKYIFIDRDGTLIEDANYLSSVNDIVFIENVFTALKSLINEKYEIVIVTNQSGIGRGFFTLKQFQIINDEIINILGINDVKIKETLFCPHKPSMNCECRKPKNGLFKNFQKNNLIDYKNSWMIGDKISDVEFGIASNLNNILFDRLTKFRIKTNDYYISNCFIDIKKIILENEGKKSK